MDFDILNEMRSPRKQLNIICKGKDPMMYSTKMLISINGSKHICVDFDENLARKLSKAKIVDLDRTWDGNVKSVEEIEGKISIQIVDADDITPRGLSKRDKLKQMEQYKQKLDAEQAALDKQISDLNNP
jgi:hypothetical protein